MKIISWTGDGPTKFDLAIVGYQFPKTKTGYDANWLVIAIEASNARTSWKANDPALLTWELQSLQTWCKEIAAGRITPEPVGFIEPCLKFQLVAGNDDEMEIEVTLAHELAPPKAKKATLTIYATLAQLRATARTIGAGLKKCPARGKPE